MFVRSKILDPPDVFQFPHQPYDIQNDFMRNLYSVIEKGKIGIFESPTGEFLCDGGFVWNNNAITSFT